MGETKKVQTGDHRVSTYKTPVFRASYPKIFKPEGNRMDPNAEPKFEITMIFNAETKAMTERLGLKASVKELKENIDRITQLCCGDFVPPTWKTPLRDGREKPQNKELEGAVFMKATAKKDRRPQVLDINGGVIAEEDNKIYGGCYCRAIIDIYNYNNVGQGITASLVAIQKVADGEPFGAPRVDASEIFGDLSGGAVDAEVVGSEGVDLADML